MSRRDWSYFAREFLPPLLGLLAGVTFGIASALWLVIRYLLPLVAGR